MTEAKHTPGPWVAHDLTGKNKGLLSVRTEQMARHIADVFPFGAQPGGADRDIDEHRANACLIAAAPDLLAALQNLLTAEGYGAQDEAEEIAWAAIAKATASASD